MKKVLSMAKSVAQSLLLPVLVFVIFAIITKGRTATERAVSTTLRQAIVPAITCYGLMVLMSLNMLNFSAGALMLCVGIIAGNLSIVTNTGVIGLLVIGILIALLMSALSGFLYNKLRVPCLVLSFGLMLAFEAFPRLIYSGGVNIPLKDTTLGKPPVIFIVLAIVLFLFYIIYNKTAFGHNLRALGSNQGIAVSVGLNIDKIKFKAFLLSGLFLGIAGILYVSERGEVRNVATLGSMQIMMDGFMGMFLGMYIAKFCNMAFAVPIGVFTMKFISNGFVSMGASSTVRDITSGVFLLVLLTISANEGLFKRLKADRLYAAEATAELSGGGNTT